MIEQRIENNKSKTFWRGTFAIWTRNCQKTKPHSFQFHEYSVVYVDKVMRCFNRTNVLTVHLVHQIPTMLDHKTGLPALLPPAILFQTSTLNLILIFSVGKKNTENIFYNSRVELKFRSQSLGIL